MKNSLVWDLPRFHYEIKNPNTLRVLWWNIQFGQSNTALNCEMAPLDKNIMALIYSEAPPDIIFLGEFEHGSLSEESISQLRKNYPHYPDDFWTYNDEASPRGIMVFSKLPFRLERSVLLDYYPMAWNDTNQIKSYKEKWKHNFSPEIFFPRRYLNLRFDWSGDFFNIIPFHSLVHIEKDLRKALGNKWLILWLLFKFSFESNNPLMHQLKRLKREMQSDFGRNIAEPVLLLGDFNLPREFFKGLVTRPYKMLIKNLYDPFPVDAPFSWPMPSSTEAKQFSNMKLKIDHLFHSQTIKIDRVGILPLRGSDHAAIYADFVIAMESKRIPSFQKLVDVIKQSLIKRN